MWALTVDVAGWPELLPATVQAVEATPGWLRIGGSARIKQPAQPWRTWTVTELEPERRLVWETPAFGGRMIARHELRLPLPEPYNPTRVEALRDRLRTPRSAAAPAREKARPNAAKKAAKQPPKKAATKVDKRGKPARAAKVSDAGERRRREPVHHVDGRREARGGRPQASRPRALEGHRYG